tara:strand:+ start:6797 stop:7225 length:429 start_codon:yes stop_codon:yes gene_type:complete
MKKIKLIILIAFCFITFHSKTIAETSYFDTGKIFFDKKEFVNAKFQFQKDIVFNPKNEKSYLYLAKIFKSEKKVDLEEDNLNTVILLNPKNEEAVYMLALLKIRQSNFEKVEELIKTLTKVCKKLCSSSKELNSKLKNSIEQ